MAAASWKGSIQFGVAQFPVKAAAVDREVKFSFNTHHAADGGRLRATPAKCEICDQLVPRSEVVRGYKGVPGVDEEYLDSLEKQRSPLLTVDALVPAWQIEPRMYRRSYDVIADAGGEGMYVLFRDLLRESDRVAIGKVVFGGQEHIVCVRPRADVLEMELLWWPEELKADAEAKAAIAGVEPSVTQMELGRLLVEAMAKDFDADSYRSEYKAAVAEYLDSFVAGKEPVKLETRPAQDAPAMSIEDALAASLAALRKAPEPKARKGKVKAA